jgi:hypothetical protein
MSTNISLSFNPRTLLFNATFKNISAISWRPVLLVEETGVPPTCGKSHANLSHNVASSTPRLSEIRTHYVSGDSH